MPATRQTRAIEAEKSADMQEQAPVGRAAQIGRTFRTSDPEALRATDKYRFSRGEVYVGSLHPLDPAFPGGTAYVAAIWGDGHEDGFSVEYDNEIDLHTKIKELVRRKLDGMIDNLVRLKAEYHELKAIPGQPARRINDIDARIKAIEAIQAYAFQHYKRGTWPNKGSFDQGRIDGWKGMADTVIVLPFIDESDIDTLNGGVNPSDVLTESKLPDVQDRASILQSVIPVIPMDVRRFDGENTHVVWEWIRVE